MITITVGAAGAGGVFDYTCDGTNDHTEILAAIAAAGTGNTVHLSAGAFVCAGDIPVDAGVSLIGQSGTTLQFPTDGYHRITANGGNVVADLDLRGAVIFTAAGSDIVCARLTSRQAIYGKAAFRILPLSGAIEDVTFDDCHAIGTSGTGFLVDGRAAGLPAALVVRNINLTGCTAIDCGAAYDNAEAYEREWICGFNLGEGDDTLTLQDVVATDCHADNAYNNGFHTEGGPTIIDCRLVRCTSQNSAALNPAAIMGSGFHTAPGWTLEDCIATGNRVGIWSTNRAPAYADDPLRITRCQSLDSTLAGIHIKGVGGCVLSNVVIDACTIRNIRAPNHAVWLYDVINAQIIDLRLIDCTGDVYQSHTVSGNTITYYLEPFAVATAAPVTGETVTFTDRSTGPSAWAWDFGDGDGSTAQHPAHAYPSAGVYPVTLAAGGNVVSQTITVVPGVSYGGARLSEADLGPIDHDPVAIATRTKVGSVRLQGSPVSRRTWTINALTDDHAEIDALAALKGQHLVLNINGVEYPGVMIRPPMLETQLTPAARAYQIGFVQETRR